MKHPTGESRSSPPSCALQAPPRAVRVTVGRGSGSISQMTLAHCKSALRGVEASCYAEVLPELEIENPPYALPMERRAGCCSRELCDCFGAQSPLYRPGLMARPHWVFLRCCLICHVPRPLSIPLPSTRYFMPHKSTNLSAMPLTTVTAADLARYGDRYPSPYPHCSAVMVSERIRFVAMIRS